MKKSGLFVWFVVFMVSSSAYAGDRQTVSVLLKQARQGDVEAMCDLGLAYFSGKEVLKDPFKAGCWIKKAYEKGSRRARTLWNDLELWRYPGNCDAEIHPAEFEQYSPGDIYRDPATGMAFVFVPGGCFSMGCQTVKKKCARDERPAHKVCLDGFWMGRYEVTQAVWQQVMGTHPSRFKGDLSRPVERVSFDDIRQFIGRLYSVTGQLFFLPTEAQWEYACRNGGKTVDFAWGDEDYRPDANCGTCSSDDFRGRTAPVGSFSPNALGLYDMGGNVKEWCDDRYDRKAYGMHEKRNPVRKGKGSSRVVRGGAFLDNTAALRCTARDNAIAGMRSDHIGFRLVLKRDD